MPTTHINNPPHTFSGIRDMLKLGWLRKGFSQPIITKDQAAILDRTPGLWNIFNDVRVEMSNRQLLDDINYQIYFSAYSELPQIQQNMRKIHDIHNHALHAALFRHRGSRLVSTDTGKSIPNSVTNHVGSFLQSRRRSRKRRVTSRKRRSRKKMR